MEYQNITFEKDGNFGVITINRPEKLNALNNQTLEELDDILDSIEGDSSLKGLVITGSGEKAFVAGADIKELSQLTADEAKAASIFGQGVFKKIEELRIPSIAAVNGFALGGGCELMLACSLRIASPNAKIGLPEVSLGVIPGYGGTQRLSRLIGRGRALEMIVTAKQLKAQEAFEIGLVNAVHEIAVLVEEAKQLLKMICKNGPIAIAYAMEAIRTGADVSMKEAELIEANLFGLCFATNDARIGLNAFLKRDTAEFKGN